MRVLVTGATGWVGTRLIPRLLAKGFHVGGTRGGSSPSHESALRAEEASSIDWRSLDLTNALSVENALAGEWDAVLHLAGIATHWDAENDPGNAWNVNAAGTARLCHALANRPNLHHIKLLLVSSGDVYGEGGGRPSRETDLPQPRSTYAASKLGAELAARGVASAKGLQVITARPWPHIGLGQKALLFPRWITALRSAKEERKPAQLKGDPKTVRDFLSVEDVVEAYIALLESGVPGETYNIASGRELSFLEAAGILAKEIDCDYEVSADPSRVGGAMYSVGDSAKLNQATGWTPTRPVEQTLIDMVHAQTH